MSSSVQGARHGSSQAAVIHEGSHRLDVRAHDAIGTRGSTFLTWSCLHHLSEHYGALFTPSSLLDERKETGQTWYPPNHFRPLVQWQLTDDENDELYTRMVGPLFQMTALMRKLPVRTAQSARKCVPEVSHVFL